MSPDATDTATDAALGTNAYAIAYRLLGVREEAHAVATSATDHLRQLGGTSRPDWMYALVEVTLDQVVAIAQGNRPHGDDPYAGLRAALRRRLEHAEPDARVAGSLLHLSGYPLELVAAVVDRPAEETVALAGIIAPPPGVDYKDLGDPQLTGRALPRPPRARRRVHWTTVAAVVLTAAVIAGATQFTGPRPTLGPPLKAGSATSAPEPTTDGTDPPGGTTGR